MSYLSTGAQILASRTSGCGDLVVNFRPQQPYDPANTYLWNLGRGPTSNQYAPVGVYPGTGTYPVSLVITLPNGTRNTYYETIQVYPKPDVRFSADDTAGCFPHHVGFQDLTVPGTGSIISRSWFFGDGNTVTGPAATKHIYGSYSNLYSVTLRVVQSVCPLDTFTLTRSSYIRVYEGIRPDFLVPPPNACRTPVDLRPVNLSTSGPAQTLTYRWTIPGATPSTSTAREPDIRFGSTGDFPARLVVRSDSGCVDSIEKTIRIPAFSFRSDFSFSADTICQGLMVDFLNKSNPTPDTSFWYFGQAQPVSGLHQYIVMRDTGLVKVKLLNHFGNCMDSVTRTIYVKPAPNMVVTSPNRFGCRVPRTVDFTYAGAPPASIRKLEWEFGDGRAFTSSSPSATNTFTAPGSYPLSLTVTDIYGCIRKSIIDSFVVIAPPRITATGLVDSGCANLVVRPKADVIAPDGVSSYEWTFGEGGPPQYTPTTTYTYSTPRTAPYPIKLKIVTGTGCVDSAAGWVTIGMPPGTADFEGTPRNACAGDSVRFLDRSTPANPITGWSWTFGDGGSSTNKNPSYAFRDTGTFYVRLRVFNNGCPSAIASKTEYIRVDGGIANMNLVPDCSNRKLFGFTNLSRNSTGFEWDFGDGSPVDRTPNPPPHLYPDFGNYTLILKATNGACTSYQKRIIPVIRDSATYSVRSLFASLCNGAVIIFTSTGTKPENISRYEWDLGDGVFIESNPSTFRVYPNSGSYQTRLRITDIHGCKDSVIGPPIIIGGPKAGFFSPDRRICKGTETAFSDTSRIDSYLRITRRVWHFGDGTSLAVHPDSLQVRHRYADTGSFNVKLVVTDDKGCSDSMQLNSYVIVNEPKAAFQSDARQSCPGGIVDFKNLSVAQGGMYIWDFGDGTRSTDRDPRHMYGKPGLYTVSLSVRDFIGCQVSDTQKSYILVDTPDASFSISDTFIRCPPLSPRFDFKGRYARDYSWTFGDGNRSSLANPTQIYQYPGNYLTRLVVTSPGGCRDTATASIRILGPSGIPATANTTGCDSVRTTFHVLNARDVDSVIWDFDDGAAATKALSITHLYARPGYYNPRIILRNSEGCLVTLPLRDTIRAYGVVPGFTVSNPLLCDRGGVSFQDTSRIVGAFKERSWDLGNGNGSSLANPSTYYASPGLYGVTLRVTTREGCTSRIQQPAAVRVVRTPRASITGDSSLCQNNTLTLKGLETTQPRDTSALRWSWDFGNGQTSSSPSPQAQSFPRAGSYAVRLLLTNSSGCTDTVTRTIRVDSVPDINMPPDTTVCLGQPLILMVTGANTYRWMPPATGIYCTTCAGTTAVPDSSTTYVVQGTNSFGCIGTDSIRVQVIRPGTIVTSAHDTLCIGGSVQLKASGTEFFTWSPTYGLSDPNIPNPVARPSLTTVYTVTGYDRKNCFRSLGTTRVMVYNYPSVFAGSDASIRSGGSLQLRPVTSSDVNAFQWTPSQGLSCTGCTNPVASPKITTTYKLTASNPGRCSSSDEVKIIVLCEADNIFLPNTFSPNGDGMNEVFYPRGSGVRSIRALRIYNRWGERVFERQDISPNDPSAGWDGRYKGRPLPPDVYVYFVDVICDNQGMVTRKGDVALIR